MYRDIFLEVVDIMHHDYAGFLDKAGWDHPEKYLEALQKLESTNQVTAERFVELVQDYLLDFKEPHMFFKLRTNQTQKQFDIGFGVRRFEDKLYVMSVGKEERLKLGDAIISLDNIPVKDLVEKHQREIMETRAEREDWRKIISKYNTAEVMDVEGNLQVIGLKKYEKEPYLAQHTVTKIDSNTLFMTLTDFRNPDTVNQLIEKHRAELDEAMNLIIDVRVNYGGSDAAYHGLAPYFFPSEPTTLDYSDYAMKFNCTERNAALEIKTLNELLDQVKDEEVRQMGERLKLVWKVNKGKGLVAFDTQELKMELTGNDYPRNIVVLSDVYCGSAGDLFVHGCKKSPKVTVIGRPTAGLNDYSNLTTIKWDNRFVFYYPTSRLDQLDYRSALADPGVKPDVYIPWTPEHIHKDVEMEAALKLLREKEATT